MDEPVTLVVSELIGVAIVVDDNDVALLVLVDWDSVENVVVALLERAEDGGLADEVSFANWLVVRKPVVAFVLNEERAPAVSVALCFPRRVLKLVYVVEFGLPLPLVLVTEKSVAVIFLTQSTSNLHSVSLGASEVDNVRSDVVVEVRVPFEFDLVAKTEVEAFAMSVIWYMVFVIVTVSARIEVRVAVKQVLCSTSVSGKNVLGSVLSIARGKCLIRGLTVSLVTFCPNKTRSLRPRARVPARRVRIVRIRNTNSDRLWVAIFGSQKLLSGQKPSSLRRPLLTRHDEGRRAEEKEGK